MKKEPMTPQEKEFVKVLLRDFLLIIAVIALSAIGMYLWMC
jgi:hypothetical protein